MTTGDKIRYFREKLGLTQEDVAKRLCTKAQNIYKYEKGIIQNIPLANIVAMAEMFGVPPSELVGWNGSPSSDDTSSTKKRTDDLKISDSPIELSANEKKLIRAYRNAPHLHDKIHTLLGISIPRDNEANYYPKLPPDFKTELSVVKVATPSKPKSTFDKKNK